MDYAALFADVASTSSPRGASREYSVEQQAALDAPYGESAVVYAGAGAGKTKVLVGRVAALLRAGVDPSRIAVVTFTRMAADTLLSRLQSQTGAKSVKPSISTVHSLALQVLARAKVPFRIPEPGQIERCLTQLKAELPDGYCDYSDQELLLKLDRCREQGATSSTLGLAALRFEQLQTAAGITDFTTLLGQGLAHAKPHFSHLLVDESQDLGMLQLSFLQKIAKPGARFWFVGDSDQSIYSFRGSESDMMTNLRALCQREYAMTVNFRSAQTIVRHANALIQHNAGRPGLTWSASRQDEGEVAEQEFETADDELNAAAEWVAQRSGRVILARTQALLAQLKDRGLPALTVHESKGLEWPEVWVLGCEAGLFPHPLADLEEERRLFYVAMTRARDKLILSYCRQRSARNAKRSRSRFLDEADIQG